MNKNCTHTWNATWKNVKNGSRCWICNQKGYYTIKNAEKYKDQWKTRKGLVYIIKCYNDSECFYKIGVTSLTVKYRFHSKSEMPYKYEIIKEIPLSIYEACYLETFLHDIHKAHSYKPTIKFEGYTECFSEILPGILNKSFDIINIIKKYT